jgi:regulator of cell morphogenesis and NO signaling
MSDSVPLDSNFARRSLADMAATLPGAAAVFQRYGLDASDLDSMSLGEAASANGLLLARVEEDLAAAAASALRPRYPADTNELIDLIEVRYHAVHRQELPQLVRLARTVEAMQGTAASAPRELADWLERMSAELRAHMDKEEQGLFPILRDDDQPNVGAAIEILLDEHDDHATHLRKLEHLARDFPAPDDSCGVWRALYTGIAKLANDLREHIYIENDLLFPRFVGEPSDKQ